MGVWERGGENDRLHFHALVKVPEGELRGELIEKTDFDRIIDNDMAYVGAIEYLLKYVSKTGERIVYSRVYQCI